MTLPPLHPDVLAWGFDRDPDDAAWLLRPGDTREHFSDLFGDMRIRVEGPRIARLRLIPEPRHRNIHDGIHGGFVLAAVDQAMFVCGSALGLERVRGGVTVDLSTQFIAAGAGNEPLDILVEILRETGRLLFVRGTAEQGERLCAAYSMTVRRATT